MVNTRQYRIVMSNSNCFPQCLRGIVDEGEAHSFKFKKGRKRISLVRNLCAVPQRAHEILNKSNVTEEQKKRQEPTRINQEIIKPNINQRIRQFPSKQKRVTWRSTSPVHSTDSERSPNKLVLQNVINYGPRQQLKPRRYSLDTTPRPIIFNRPTTPSILNNQRNNQKGKSRQRSPLGVLKQIAMNQSMKKSRNIQDYLISPIKQVEEQRQKSSSLFQGAKSIVSRLVTSRKINSPVQIIYTQTAQKVVKPQFNFFYQNIRLCQTNHGITTCSIMTDQQQRKRQNTNQISLDSIPSSPHTKTDDQYSRFKIGKLLGVGKWAHVYLCQQKETKSIYVIKQIFKQSLKMKYPLNKMSIQINSLMSLNHGKLINIQAKFQTKDKICIITQYCSGNIFQELSQKGCFSLQKLKKYSSDIIQAVVYLHQNQTIHGNLNIFQVFTNFNLCKLKLSMFYNDYFEKDDSISFKDDIQALAIIIFEMSYGLIPISLTANTLYEKQKLYRDPSSRSKILSFINFKTSLPNTDHQYTILNDLIKLLLNWNQSCRLTVSPCLNHPFFDKENHIDF